MTDICTQEFCARFGEPRAPACAECGALDAFRWTGDLAAFAAWYGEAMPVDFGEQISVPTGEPGRYLRVWCGSWILRYGGKCHTVTDEVFRTFIQGRFPPVLRH